MASMNPASILKIENRKGSIEVGKEADLVVMNPVLDVLLTLRQGREVYRLI
jgi:N-acetylglucosamine-6-phosphate deacetylase